jgi:integrase
LTIDELALRFWRWAEGYYQRQQAGTYKTMIRLVRQYYGLTGAAEFGPSKLRLLREEMIRGDESADPPRAPWSRRYVNQQMQRLRQMFKWAASHEMLPSAVYEGLTTVEPLKRGRTNARETEKVGPVPQHLLDGVRPHLNCQVRALVELQLLTGARPGELLVMRAIDIEMPEGEAVWVYRPAQHKNAFRDLDRTIYLGPRAQQIIRPFLADRAVDAFLFSPAEAEAERRAAIHAARRTPLSCGNRPGTNRRTAPKRTAGDRYTTVAYYRAIQYACDRAFPPPTPLAKEDGETHAEWQDRLTDEQKAENHVWRREHRWHPHQLRHNAGTMIRKACGLEAAQLALGHASAQITDAVYAERDHAKVIEVMRKIG